MNPRLMVTVSVRGFCTGKYSRSGTPGWNSSLASIFRWLYWGSYPSSTSMTCRSMFPEVVGIHVTHWVTTELGGIWSDNGTLMGAKSIEKYLYIVYLCIHLGHLLFRKKSPDLVVTYFPRLAEGLHDLRNDASEKSNTPNNIA